MAVMGSSGYEIPAGKKPSRDELIEHVEDLVAEAERLRLWIRRIDNINDDPARFSKEIDQACRDALDGKPMVGLINADGP